MSASSIISRIKSLPQVRVVDYLPELNGIYLVYEKKNGEEKEYHIFMPTRDDYYLDISIIDKAVKKKANLIIYDNWIKYTGGAKEYAATKGIPVYSYSQFLAIMFDKGTL